MTSWPRRLRERPLEEFRDVEPADVLAVLRLRGVVEHDQAIRARGGDRIGPRLLDVAQSAVVPPLARPLVHPHSGPARTATESAIAAFAHLDDAHARDPVQHVARLIVYVIVTAEVAGVVVRQELQGVPRPL